MNDDSKDVLERNVETLLEAGGEPPRMADAARARIRANLMARAHAAPVKRRRPLLAAGLGLGLAATAAVALIVTRAGGHDAPVGSPATQTLADGSTWVAGPGGKVTVLGDRRVRVEGAALLDVAPGKGTFVVETARGRIEVLGTRFLVDAQASKTTAAVVRGQVKLASDAGDVLLHAGEQGVAEPGRPPTRGPAPRLSHLVSWAAQARRADDIVTPVHHGTLFARDTGVRSHPPWGEEYPLPLKKLGVDVVIENQVARVALDQTFHNNRPETLEGVYRFAIPPDAALQRLAMYVDGKLTESAVVERMRARRIYEELVYRRVDPALLEWTGTGRLALRVFPLVGNQDKRLMLAYTQSLPRLYGDWSIDVPLPEIDQPVGEVAFDVTVKGCGPCEISSTSHQISVAREGGDAVVTYRNTNETIGDSLVLHVRDPRRDATVATHAQDGETFVMARAQAELPRVAAAYHPRTWVILDDVSASRGALERRAQLDLIDAFARELDEDDRLAVIAFDVAARPKLAPTRVLDVDRTALRAALRDEGGVGATDVGAALDAATALLAGVAPEDAMIVYLGDGVITSGPRQLDALRARLAGKATFVGVGVGDGPDTQTLDALAAATGGYATTIDLADDVGWRAFDLVAALHTQRVTGIEARLVDASGAPVPATVYVRSPQLADGEELEVIAKLAGAGTPAAVELTGTTGGAPWRDTIALAGAATTDGAYLPRLWAQRHIAARLLAKHEPVAVPPCTAKCASEAELRQARDEQIRKEVVALGKKYFLLSRHTSLLVLENDAMYAKYDVTKGAGQTWAPYAMPATIPVVASAPIVPAAADDDELVRAPLPVFYSYARDDAWLTMPAVTRGTGTGSGYGIGGRKQTTLAQPDQEMTRADLGLLGKSAASATDVLARSDAEPAESKAKADAQEPAPDVVGSFSPGPGLPARYRRAQSTTGLGGWGVGRGGGGGVSGADFKSALQRFSYPTDVAFDDVSAHVPALFPDAADAWRDQLGARAATPHVIDDAARALLAKARAALPVGVYRWDGRELAVDGARRIGWRRTTERDLAETASYDGATWTRRYAELGLDVTRAVADDDVALALAYLPIWIAEPAHFARWFEVRGKDARTITLARDGKVAFELAFDDRARLVAIRDRAGAELLSVTWDAAGPTAARADGRELSVGFTGQAITDAVAWAHGAARAPAVVAELPAHRPSYWLPRLAREQAGSAAWRRVQRQLLVAYAAQGDRGALFRTYEQLRAHGGVELGDLALASAGVATSSTDAQLAAALAPFTAAGSPGLALARYLLAGRAYGKAPRPETLRAEVSAGLVGALWQLREVVAYAAANKPAAVERLVAMGDRARELRVIGAAALAQRGSLTGEQLAQAWDAVAAGPYRNTARAQAVTALVNRGAYDAAFERAMVLVAELDLAAPPPSLRVGWYGLAASRRGPAGVQLLWATWRDKVLAAGSFEHVMALAGLGAQRPAELPAVLARAAELAGADDAKLAQVVRLAMGSNLGAWAQAVLEARLAQHPTYVLHQLAGQLALVSSRPVDALAHFEAAQQLAADDVVGLSTVRAELMTILQVARQAVTVTSGAERAAIVARAADWARKWRAIDEGNPEVDQLLGELYLATGDAAEGWRQLSTVIERDPMAGTGYMTVAETFEQQGRVEDALAYWQQAIVLDQTNPTPRVRKAQALIALGRHDEGDALLREVVNRKWHDVYSGVTGQARYLLQQRKPR